MDINKLSSSPVLRTLPLAVVAGVFALSSLGQAKTPAAPRASIAAGGNASVSIPKNMVVATLGGGCFWSMEAIYKRLKGVQSATPGYAGGTLVNPTYEQVGSGTTGHAESIQIVYDPKVISYAELVDVLLSVLDPTTLNAQGADTGTNYRSVIFTRNAQEQKVAQAEISKINAEHLWNGPIVTQVAPIKAFYRAEDYHLNYYDTHQTAPYCSAVIGPKLEKLRAKFGNKLK